MAFNINANEKTGRCSSPMPRKQKVSLSNKWKRSEQEPRIGHQSVENDFAESTMNNLEKHNKERLAEDMEIRSSNSCS